MAEVDAAKSDGRWATAYEPQRNATIPEDLAAALAASPRAARGGDPSVGATGESPAVMAGRRSAEAITRRGASAARRASRARTTGRRTVRIRSYSGPDAYELTGGEGATADVRLVGGYNYWYFDDDSTVDFTEVYPTCSITVSEPEPGARIHATVSCANLVAQITSPDYDERNAAGFRPSVSLSVTFDCEI